MARITRKTQGVFAGSLEANLNISVFGSKAAGTPAYSLDPAALQSARYLNGWAAALTANRTMELEDLNALHYLHSLQTAYLMQQGVPEWDTATPYYTGSIATAVGTGKKYLAVADSTGTALTDRTKWEPIDPGYPLGSVLATFPNLNGSYACSATTIADGKGFVKCNGQTIVDTTSPMNGVVVPYINNDVFLMGNATAGTASGLNTRSFSHSHTFTGTAVALPYHVHTLDENGAAMLTYNMYYSTTFPLSNNTVIKSGSQSVKSNVNVTYGDDSGALGYHAQEFTDTSDYLQMIRCTAYSGQTIYVPEASGKGTALGGVTAGITSGASTYTAVGTIVNNTDSYDIRPKYITSVFLMRVR